MIAADRHDNVDTVAPRAALAHYGEHAVLAFLPLIGCGSGAATVPGAGTEGSVTDSAVDTGSGGGAGGDGQANDAGLTNASVERDDEDHTDAGTSCVSVTGDGPEPWWDAKL